MISTKAVNKSRLFQIAILVFFATGCSESNLDDFFTRCVTQGTEEQMQNWQEFDAASVKQGVQQGCKVLVKECELNPGGAYCKAAQEKFSARETLAQ